MDNTLSQFFNSPDVTDAMKDLDARQLERGVGSIQNEQNASAVDILRLAAITSLAELIGDYSVDVWFRPSSQTTAELSTLSILCFLRWQGYFDALIETKDRPSLDDMLMFAVVGLIAKRDHEVRDELRRPLCRQWLDSLMAENESFPWINQVRANISAAILYIIRQENHTDINQGNIILQKLADVQKRTEPSWIANSPSQKRDAATLLGFYHLAEAVILTSHFLVNGFVEINGKDVSDFAAELRRLLVRSEEFLQLSGDAEQILWLQTAAGGLAYLRSSSIWVQAKGISERIDQLLNELANTSRQNPLFSLLPAQQDALRDSLLDASRVAIVLQMPTSSGKTLLAEFSIVQTFDAFRDVARAVYVVPTRALATQIRRTLTEDLHPLNIKVATIGSAFEEDPYELELLNTTDGVIVTTPEKLDLLLRAHPEWFASLRLVVVDEAHLIQDAERGAHLELLLANLRREQPDARLLLLTPFMENAKEIAEWLSRERSKAISIHWRPTRVLLGMAKISGAKSKRALTIDWTDPYNSNLAPRTLRMPTQKKSDELSTNTDRVLFLADTFRSFGTELAIFSASPSEAEKAALQQAEKREPTNPENLTPEIRVAMAIARHEFGLESKLAYCLQRGVAFHHSSLSPITRYLIEDQIRDKKIDFVAATSTLAQGMNFPVATILVHSVHKPRGAGNFTASEFWNIAGRAGRIGLAEKGLVLFADPSHQEHLERYSQALSESLYSAMLAVLSMLDPEGDLKQQYRDYPTIRPFIQYLAHAAATSSVTDAIRNLEALVEQSLVNQQIAPGVQSRKLRAIARNYLQQLLDKSGRLIKVADTTGLGTFSFNELYAKLRDDPILKAGPQEVIKRGKDGLFALVDALKWLPELNLAIGFGEGNMDVEAVAKAVQGWIDGMPIHEIAEAFPGEDETKRIRDASRYLNSTVSQTLSWGAHAFMKGWAATADSYELAPEDSILPSLIQYGVKTPEAVVASMLGVPRSFAEATADEYRSKFGRITTSNIADFREFIDNADIREWNQIVERSPVHGITGEDFRTVFREMQGLIA
jgi:hypothetical protein